MDHNSNDEDLALAENSDNPDLRKDLSSSIRKKPRIGRIKESLLFMISEGTLIGEYNPSVSSGQARAQIT